MLPRVLAFALALAVGSAIHGATNLLFNSSARVAFQFGGFVGERLAATVDHWITPAPVANPGMFEMFRLRDREPAPNLVPWAGEFAGKYLISAIQLRSLGMDVPSLPSNVAALIASQAEDGYLGPFPKRERLLGHWDLWGHYHCMLALLMWHDVTGEAPALEAVRRAADLVCRTYLDSGRRAIDAGSDEMNLSIIHVFGWLYRLTAEPRYLRMMRDIEKDWERGGDFVQKGLDGVEFFQTPRPRWESLHSLQGLVELYRITGEEKYRRAFEHHWRSIARWDLRNTGGFSSGEQATGNPYANSAIETCCSIAWMALSVDMLKLTGDSRVADLLELATLNAWAGAQHPSGRWCTYNTPMDGAREASAHSIVFQSRAGTPELNCCSVNGPRGWGMLTEWAALKSEDGYVINWLGPFSAAFPNSSTNAPKNSALPEPFIRPQISVMSEYPLNPEVTIKIDLERAEEFTLRVRIPEWSRNTRAKLNDEQLPNPKPGAYLVLKRQWNSHWRKADVLTIRLDFEPRIVPGSREALGKVSLYRGPLLLAWDQRFNDYDEASIPALDLAAFRKNTGVSEVPRSTSFRPLVLLNVPGMRNLTLCDFASAGALGSRYRSWLPATNAWPGPPVTRVPRDGSVLPPGKIAFRWTGSPREHYALLISDSENFASPKVKVEGLTKKETLLELDGRFEAGRRYFWQVIAANEHGRVANTGPAASFYFDPSLPPTNQPPSVRRTGPNADIVRASVTNGPLNGVSQRLSFRVEEWPEENYAVELRFRLLSFPINRIGQVFSAWAGPSDDPLRITVDQRKLYARLEMGGSYSTEGTAIELGRWYKVVAKKQGDRLRLFIDDKERGSCAAPQFILTQARDFAVGGNPHYQGNEFLHAEFSEVVFSE